MEWGNGHQRYEQIQEIGVGAYGTVYRARDRENDGQIVALKRLRVQASEEGMPLATVREIALLKQLERFDHPNIVRLLDVCCGRRTARETRLTLVFEHVDFDLESFMQQNQPIDLNQAKDITKQLLTASIQEIEKIFKNNESTLYVLFMASYPKVFRENYPAYFRENATDWRVGSEFFAKSAGLIPVLLGDSTF